MTYVIFIIKNKDALPLHWNPPINTDIVKKSWKFIKTIYLAYLKQYLEDYVRIKYYMAFSDFLNEKFENFSSFKQRR